MRDTLILLIIVAASAWSLRKPWIGIIGWTVVSLGSPHAEFGYAARDWPVATGFAACTLLGMLLTRERQNPLIAGGPRWLLAFVAWTCITLPFSVHFEWSLPLWERSMKIYLMLFATLVLIDDLRKLQVFIWANVLPIAYFGIKGGVFTIVTGGSFRVWGPGGFIEGNNEVALAVITIVPLLRYLQQQMTDRLAKLAMTGAMALCVITALGTYSRGALIGLAAMGLFFWWRGGNKILWGGLILVLGAVALSLMPAQWWERMDTIKSYDTDLSALGRINAWWMAFNLAKDQFFGGGFMVSTALLFSRYAPDPQAIHAAHSIYFQVLGEHGFVGLALFLAIGVATWRCARRLMLLGVRRADLRWAAELGAMVQVSMIAFGTGGAFLSLAYYDLPYNMMAIAALALHLGTRALAAPVQAQPVLQEKDWPAGIVRPAGRP